MKLFSAFTVLLVTVASIAIAHEGVKNATVMARMEGMSEINAATKVLGQMVKGQVAFDQAAVREAAAKIAEEAGRIQTLFEAEESDPKSEALPSIWSNFTDFTAKAEATKTAAETAGSVTSLDELRPVLVLIGQTCSDCHRDYRK